MMIRQHTIRRRAAQPRRRATAIVEFAVVAPLFTALLFGVIEFGWVFMIQQSLTTAAREGVRTAVLQGATDQDIQDRISEFMSQVRADAYAVEITHGTADDPIEKVRITVPYKAVSLLRGASDPAEWHAGAFGFDLGASCSMRKEGAG